MSKTKAVSKKQNIVNQLTILENRIRFLLYTMVLVTFLHVSMFLIDAVYSEECKEFDIFIQPQEILIPSVDDFDGKVHVFNTSGSSKCFTAEIYHDFSKEDEGSLKQVAESVSSLFGCNQMSRALYWLDLFGVILLGFVTVLVGICAFTFKFKVENSVEKQVPDPEEKQVHDPEEKQVHDPEEKQVPCAIAHLNF